VNSDSQSNLSNNLLKKLAPLKELAMDSLEEGVTIADFTHPLQPLVFANQGFTEITGYTVDETVGKNCRFLQGPETEPEVVRKIKYAVMNGHSITCRLKNYRKNGEMFINNLSLKPIRNDDDKVTHYVGIQSDVTSLVDAENAEIEALKRVAVANAATESKSKFLAHMSHEIRTPLNGLIAVGQLLESTKLDREQRDLVTTMQSSGETLQALISDILDFSRVEAEKLSLASEPFNPEALIANVLEIVGIHAGRLKLNVGYHVDEGVPKTVLGDAMRVQQVLLNSINNAIKFTEQGDIMVRLYIGMAPKKGGMQRVHSVLAMNDDWITPLSELQHMCPHFLPKKENVGKEEEEEQQKCPFHNQHSSKQKALQQEQQQNTIKRSHELSEATTKVTTNISTHSETFGSGNDADEVNAHDKPVYLHFYVKDTGIGLPPDMIREVFNSFQQVDDGTTRKFDGSGLGLAISKKLCEAMGGTIWAESEGLGKGSTFHFCIKCQTSREKDSSIESKIVQKIGEFSALKHHEESWIPKKISMSIGKNDLRSTILIFDESRMICKTIESSLKQWNIKTDVVSSAQKLFEKLDSDIEEHPNEKNRKYGCIIAQRSLKFE
jgi:PAS domain S-box-containing protein